MSRRYGPVLYPSVYFGTFVSTVLSKSFTRLAAYYTNTPRAKLFAFELLQPASVLVKITSRIGAERGWKRAGYVAQSLRGTPLSAPRKDVQRVYLDNQYFSFAGDGFPYYFEFWPHGWLSDYQIEIWAKLAPELVIDTVPDGSLLLFGTGDGSPAEQFTFFGELINFPP